MRPEKRTHGISAITVMLLVLKRRRRRKGGRDGI